MTNFSYGEAQLDTYIPDILKLYGLVYPAIAIRQTKALRSIAAHRNSFGAVLFAHQLLVGFIILSDLGKGSAEVIEVAIHPNYRRQSGAKKLFHKIQQQLDSRHIREIFLEVRSDNHPALALYHVLGFQNVGLRKGYYPSDAAGRPRLDAFILRKNNPVA